MEIERKPINMVIHGVLETDAEQDIEKIAETLGTGLRMDFDGHVLSIVGKGKLEENKSKPLRTVVKFLDGKKEILSRAKDLKNFENL